MMILSCSTSPLEEIALIFENDVCAFLSFFELKNLVELIKQ
jgi:hypothetical protein